MVWPSTKSPQGLRYNHTLDRTILGCFYQGHSEVRNLWCSPAPERLRMLQQLPHWRRLPADVLDKYARSTYAEVRRIIYLWRGIEASLIASNVNLMDGKPQELHCRLWRWCITSAIHSYDNTAKIWKKFTLHILHYCNKVPRDDSNPMPREIPGHNKGSLGPCWFKLIPALKFFAYAKILKNMRKIPMSAYDDIGHLIQARMMPPPDLGQGHASKAGRFEVEYEELKRQFTRKSPWTEAMDHRLDKALNRFCNYVSNIDFTPRPHISLSGSGCYELGRIDGGRAMYIQRLFIQKYVRSLSRVTTDEKTWFGAPLRYKVGQRPFRTICRSEDLVDNIPFLRSSFRNEFGPGGLLFVTCADENEHEVIEDPMFGLDEALPQQILQLCIEEAVERGYTPGPPWWGPRNSYIQMPIPTKVIFQPESGNKVRALSETPACVTIMLQPFAHWLTAFVRRYPILRSAFTRSYKGWDLAVLLTRRKDNHVEPGSGFSVIDLVGSTNGFHWNLVRRILSQIVFRFSRNVYETFYFTQCINLLCAPRRMEVRRDHRDVMHRIIMTERGIHMGDPGSKEILCTIQALIELMVYNDVEKLPPSLVAGDDHGAVRTKARHDRLVAMHIAYGNEIQETKAQFSYNFCFFTEELLVYIPEAIGLGKAPWELKDDEDHLQIHRDILKMRLLSPYSSTGSFDIQKNPAFGKGSTLHSHLLYHKNECRKQFFLHTFNNWMASFLGQDPLVYLPRVVGGCNVPYPGTWDELAERVLAECHPALSKIYQTMSESDEENVTLHVLVRAMSTGNSSRGIVDPTTTFAATQYMALAKNQFGDQLKTTEQLLAEIQSTKSYQCSYHDAIAYAKRLGMMSTGDILENIDRMTAMRITFACAAGLIPVEEILAVRRDRVPTPSEVLDEFLTQELPHVQNLYRFDPSVVKATPESLSALETWIRKGAPNFVPKMRGEWVPGIAVMDSMVGMSIPFSHPQNRKRKIPGSIDDENIDIYPGYAATVISRKRHRIS